MSIIIRLTFPLILAIFSFAVQAQNQTTAEYLQQSSALNHPDSCYKLANIYQDGNLIAQNKQKMLELYEKSCNLKYTQSCDALSDIYNNGELVTSDRIKSLNYEIKSCDYGSYAACASVARNYADSYSKEQDLNKAAYYYEQSCKLDDTYCPELSELLIELKQYEQAIPFLKKNCTNKNQRTCTQLGNIYSYLLAENSNIKQAIFWYNKGCPTDALACLKLGMIYEAGEKVPQDYNKAYHYFQKTCTSNNVYCPRFVYWEDIATDAKTGNKLFNECNNENNLDSCKQLAQIHNMGGIQIRKDQARSHFFYKKTCEAGVGEGCYLAAQILNNYHESDAPKRIFYEKGCDLNHGDSCGKIADIYLLLNARKIQTATSAMELAQKGCDLESGIACNVVAEILGRRYLDQAITFLNKSCDLNYAEACFTLGDVNQHILKKPLKALGYYSKACQQGLLKACPEE